jgi:protein involved in polysaccharide export with SLBB domain
MKIQFLFLIMLVSFTCVITPTFSQTRNPRDVNVNNLSEQQIMQIIEEIEKRGLTENDAIALARAKGLKQDQIDVLKKRMTEVKSRSGESSISSTSASGYNQIVKDGDGSLEFVKVELDSTKVDSRIFGFSLFNNEKLTFEPSINIPVPDSYILGPGDELVVDIWGASQQTYQLSIDQNGNVKIPLIGPLCLGGLTLEVGENRILNRLSSIYSDLNSSKPRTFASVRTGNLKTIRVNVIGEVYTPGSFTLPGTASLFNVLYLAGGPNKQGSFRDIQLIRNGKVISHLDVYDFLIDGNTEINVSLLDNDIVMIPTYINRVKMYGEFKRTGIFEAKDNETVANMVHYAGDYDEAAYKGRIELYRNGPHEKEFKNVTNKEMSSVLMMNGDSLYVGKILDRFTNKVNIVGAVFTPGNYEYLPNLKLSELIKEAGGLLENAYVNRGTISRLKDDFTPENLAFNVEEVVSGKVDILLKPNDAVFISSIDDMREAQTVAIWGEIQKMGLYQYGENITLGDLVLMAGGFKESASGSSIEVMRRLPYEKADVSADAISQLFNFSISRDLGMNDEGAQFILMPFDEVFVRYMPGFRKNAVITISGQVMYTGNYGLASRVEKISDLVKRAGGLTPYAYPNGAKLIRQYVLSDEEKAKRRELMIKDSTLRFSELDFETVSIDLEDILANPGGKNDIYMEHGDVLDIPSSLQTIKVSGAVLNPSSTVFVKGLRSKQYINNSGGFSVYAKKSKTYVLYPNGSAASARGFIFKRYPVITPGAEIVVPKKPERKPLGAAGWFSIAGAMASLSLTIVTVVNLAK